MSKMIKTEEPFQMKIFERINPPKGDECFLLYRQNYEMESCVIIMPDGRYSSAEVRHKKCDRKVILYTGECVFSKQYKIDMINKLFSYEIRIDFKWRICRFGKFYFEEKIENDELDKKIKMLILKENRRWDINQEIELQQTIEADIESLLKEYLSIDIYGVKVEVEQDEDAKKYLEHNKETYINLKNMENQEIINEHKKKILEKNINRYGLSGLHVMDMLENNISKSELYDKINAAEKERFEKINYAYEKDYISHETASRSIQDSINGISFTHDVYGVEKKNEIEEKLDLEECPADEDIL